MDAATGRARPAGIAADIAKKISGRRDAEEEQKCLDWIGQIIGEQLPAGQFEDVLRDGIILCKLINAIKPGSVKKVTQQGGNFLMMQNIENYNKATEAYGLSKEDIFQSVDLWDRKNVPAVLKAIFALDRVCQKNNFNGPVLRPINPL